MKAYLPIFPTKAECETRLFLHGDPYPYVCIWTKDILSSLRDHWHRYYTEPTFFSSMRKVLLKGWNHLSLLPSKMKRMVYSISAKIELPCQCEGIFTRVPH